MDINIYKTSDELAKKLSDHIINKSWGAENLNEMWKEY